MWILRMVLVSVCAAAVSMALGAPAATAQTVEVMVENDGHCPPVEFEPHEPHGGCEISAHTSVQTPIILHNHVEEPGEEHIISVCDNEFEASVGEDGNGYIYHQQLAGVNCGLESCDEASPSHENLPWELHIRVMFSVKWVRITICIRLATDPEGTAGTPCTVDAEIVDAGDHEYVLAASEAPCINLGGAVELSGGWFVEGTGLELEDS